MEELATVGEFGGNLKRELKKLFLLALGIKPDDALAEEFSLVASKGPNRKVGDYQWCGLTNFNAKKLNSFSVSILYCCLFAVTI